MKKRHRIRLRVGLGLLAVAALVLAMLPTQARAQVNCAIASTTLDFDNDGFTDAQECAGITLFDKTPFPGVVSGQPRAGRLDPNTKDVFVILVRATPTSLIPTTVPYQFISASQSAGGLGLFVHEISKTQAAADRTVTGVLGSQKAARLTESLDTNGDILGIANQGMDLDAAVVYTQRIVNFVNSVYASVRQTPPPDLINTYIKHTIAHECGGHIFRLAPVYNANFGGNHYQSGTFVDKYGAFAIMEQSVTYTVKSGKVTFNISTAYTDVDQAAAQLK